MKVGLSPNFLASIPLMKEVQPETNAFPCHINLTITTKRLTQEEYLRDIYKVCICQGRVNVVPHVRNCISHEVAKGKLGGDTDLKLFVSNNKLITIFGCHTSHHH